MRRCLMDMRAFLLLSRTRLYSLMPCAKLVQTAFDLSSLAYVAPVLLATPIVIPWVAHLITDYLVEQVL